MTTLQQGWIYCADGFGWLQRLTIVGAVGPGGLCVDLSQLSGQPEPAGVWDSHMFEDGWYRDVPARMVNDLAELHGGVVDVLSSRLDLGPTPESGSRP
jgi:hypothetical protein